METYIFAAGCLSLALGLIHSVMGEILIFRRMRKGQIIPTNGHPLLKESHVRILWASWHLVTIFGGGIRCNFITVLIPQLRTYISIVCRKHSLVFHAFRSFSGVHWHQR
jgi:hypothetical protein